MGEYRPLKQYLNAPGAFTARIARTGNRHTRTRRNIPTVLLHDVKDSGGCHVAHHVWVDAQCFPAWKQPPGTTIQFTASAVRYRRRNGSVGYTLGEIGHDFRILESGA